jgi:hypothetical protein
MLLRIAVASEDGATMAKDFLRTACYHVFEAEDGVILSGAARRVAPEPQGGDESAADLRTRIVQPVLDCHFLLLAGLEPPDFEVIAAHGIRPFVIAFDSPPREVVEMLITGRLRRNDACDCHGEANHEG